MTSVISGIAVGLVAGYALQRGGFCMHTAFRSILFEKDKTLVYVWITILVINIPVLLLLEQVGVVFPARAPLTWQAGLVGGLIFGAGMVLAGGCVSGTFYRASKGMMGSVVALTGFVAGGLMMTSGVFAPFRRLLTRNEIAIAGEEASFFNLPSLVVPSYFASYGIRWVIVAIVVVPLVVVLIRAPRPRFAVGWKWPVTGLVFGAVAVGAWVFSSFEYRDYGLSIVGPTNALSNLLFTGDGGGINWAVWFLIGLPPGAFVAAWRGGDLSLRVPSAPRLLQNLIGGVVMGWGASLAGGCNIGHGITGLSVLSLGSVWATAATLGGVWLTTAVVYRVVGRRGTVGATSGSS